RGARWRRLMVLKADVARYWPFAAALDYRTGAPGRPSGMQFVEEEYRARLQRCEAKPTIGDEAKALLATSIRSSSLSARQSGRWRTGALIARWAPASATAWASCGLVLRLRQWSGLRSGWTRSPTVPRRTPQIERKA